MSPTLGGVTQYHDSKAKWFVSGESGDADIIEEAKQIIESKVG